MLSSFGYLRFLKSFTPSISQMYSKRVSMKTAAWLLIRFWLLEIHFHGNFVCVRCLSVNVIERKDFLTTTFGKEDDRHGYTVLEACLFALIMADGEGGLFIA
jgi:hypothetical protein